MNNHLEPNVLIACVIDKAQEFCLEKFFESVNKQDTKFDLLFVDKSENERFLGKLKEIPAKVLSFSQNESQTAVPSQKIKDYALKNGYDYVLFTTIDMVLPENTLTRLIFHKKDLISGVYLSNMKLGDKYEISPCLYDFAQEGHVRVLELREVIDDKLIEIFCAGLNCTLVSKVLLEKMDDSFFKNGSLKEEIAFFLGSKEKGFEAFADTSVKCNRQVKNDDPVINKMFSFDSYPNIRNPRVLVGSITYDKHSIYLNGFLDSIRSQDYKNYDLVFVETSNNKEFIATLKGTGAIVLEGDSNLDHKIKIISSARQQIFDYAKKNNYDYILFVDSDITLPKIALSKLISNRKDIVAAPCLSLRNVNGNAKVLPNVYDFSDEEDFCRPMWLNETLNNNIVPVACAGFGCVLISKQVFEQVKLRYFEKSMAGEDIAFFVDSRKEGFNAFSDNSVKCTHLIFPPGDPRNRKFMFETYEKGVSYNLKINNI